MEENDDKIRELFAEFDPRLSSEARFTERLTRAMDSVEMIRQRSAEQRRRNRRAVVWAAVAGFVAGAAVSSVWPTVGRFLTDIAGSLTTWDTAISSTVVSAAGWLIVGGAAVGAALTTFERASAPAGHR